MFKYVLAFIFTSLTAPASAATPGVWFDGRVEAAFDLARTSKKPLLLYWGAVWCPPCNELKQQVFSTTRFAELSKTLIAVQLDGDGENAQTWADKLKVAGYPTVLVFDPSGREVMRLAESLDIHEFERALTSALSSGGTLSEAMLAGKERRASLDQWRMLATYQWSESAGLPESPAQRLATQLTLAQNAPRELKVERAVLAAQTLVAASEYAQDEDVETKKVVAAIKNQASELIDAVFEDRHGVWAARSTVILSAKTIITWLYPEASESARSLESRWLAAAAAIGRDPRASVDTRLMSLMPEIELVRFRQPGPPSKELVAKAQQAVRRAEVEAKTPYERHAVISDAAMMLAAVEDFAGAETLLEAELKTTNTPWYYESTLSYVLRDAGKLDAALNWSEKARKSVQGRASRLQWIVSDLLLVAETPHPQRRSRLVAVTQAYYDLALSLPDGFAGRNARRSQKVAAALGEWLKDAEIKKVVGQAGKLCRTEACAAHFAQLDRASK